jgi:GntR family transcriptional regulator, transcriptional repressor for pyruvate dehydrogenase complex
VEPAAAHYAAARRTTVQLQALSHAGAHFNGEAADTAAAVTAVVEFFTAVAVASGNQVLALTQASLNELLAPALTRMIDRIPQARRRIGEAQTKITAAIKLKQSEQARSWMEKHIRDFKRGHVLALDCK